MKKINKMKSSKLGNSSSAIPTSVSVSSTAVNGRPKVSGQSTSVTSAQDESNLKVIRDLCHLEANRCCFECGQRGPTYVDVTIGSFICMQCSGLLRGLTPPHRVKSISMASFSSEEMEILKARGNEYCRKVWLATYTTKDIQLNSSDPDRLNALKGLLTSKYEQKRYYIDPSRLPKSELSEIQGKNLNAMVNGNVSSKSPTSRHSNPSPVLNNLRSNINSSVEQGKPRLVNSVTLPDIKPLSALDPGFCMTSLNADLSTLSISSTSSSSSSGVSSTSISRRHTNQNGIHPPPIQFINNLSANANNGATTNQSGTNHFQLLSPWDENNGIQEMHDSSNADFNTDFADFEDAFNNKEGAQETQPQLPHKYTNGGFKPKSMQMPIKPNGEAFQNGFYDGVNGKLTINGNGSSTDPGEDKYAALKDLDSLFKQNPEAVTGTSPLQSSSGLTSSMSVPANLSSSSLGQDPCNNGWFSSVSSSSTQNPFSHVNGSSCSPTWQNGIATGSGLNNSSHGQNFHNPFYGNNNNGIGGNNGWFSAAAVNTTNFAFSSSPGSHSHPFPPSQIQEQQSQIGSFRPKEQSGLKSGFNPFFGQQQSLSVTSNPNNPFL